MDEILGDPGASFPQNGLPGLIDSLDRLLVRVSHHIHSVNRLYYHNLLSAKGIVLTLLGLILLLLLPPLVRGLLHLTRHLQPNFRNQKIPQSYGLVILLWAGALLVSNAYLIPIRRMEDNIWLGAVLGFGLLGLIDDIWGTKTIKGIRGHFRAALQQRKITTGFIKAVGGGLLAFALAYRLTEGDWLQTILDAALIALSSNAINLLDLRPGRACSIFLLFALPLLGFSLWAPVSGTPALMWVVVPALVVWPRDAAGRAMLGDTGSNLLGATLGLALCSTWVPAGVQWTALALLIGFHLLTERISLTKLIAQNRLLNSLDRLTGVR